MRPSVLALAVSVSLLIQQRPPAGQPGPWNNDIVVIRVRVEGGAGANDGAVRIEQLASFPRAGVSSLARLKDGRLIAAHQYFPEQNDADFDKVAVHFSADEGRSWTSAAVITVAGLPEGMRFPFDPTLVPLPDGSLRLYFTSRRQGQADLPAIYSALSSDGVHYSFEPGRRFGLEGRPVIDCAVVIHRGVFHLFAPDNGPALPPGPGSPMVGRGAGGMGYHATSSDGLTFSRQPDVSVPAESREATADPDVLRRDPARQGDWLGAAWSDDKVITFFGTGAGVWMATSVDGARWQPVGRLPVAGADPGAVPASGGGWIVSVTGPPRR
jgi:hypothetical protein